MKTKKNAVKCLAVSFVAFAAMLHSASAALTLGVQFSSNWYVGAGSSNLGVSDSFGAPGYESSNYNVFNMDMGGGDSVPDAMLSSAALVDSSGSSVAATISTSGFDYINLTGSSNSTPATKFYKHGLALSSSSTGTISVNNLAASGFSNYDLIIYFSKSVFHGGINFQTPTVTVNGSPLQFQLNAYQDSSTFGFQDASIIGGANDGTVPGNYLRITGLSGDLSIALASSTYPNGINGFQIIQGVPEPGVPAMGAAFGLMLISLRRRRR